MRTLILGGFEDRQTALYVMDSFSKFSSDVIGIDVRRIIADLGYQKGQQAIMDEIGELDKVPDVIMALKGLEMLPVTLKKIKNKFPKAKLVNWFFDKYLQDKPIWETTQYLDVIDLYDYFFCSLKGVADKLREIGKENVYYLDEACHENYNGEVYCNHYQEEKYGEDIAFCGSLGYFLQHKNRVPTLEKIAKAGFRMKIWGSVICDWKYIPGELRQWHMNTPVINENHSRVVQSSLINLGVEQDVDVEFGFSARLYRVMSAGGLYLTNNSNGLNKMFKVNEPFTMPTGEEELLIYYDDEHMIKILDFLLEHDKIRQQVAMNGQKVVLENHKFTDRIKEMLKIIKVK